MGEGRPSSSYCVDKRVSTKKGIDIGAPPSHEKTWSANHEACNIHFLLKYSGQMYMYDSL